MKVSGRIKKITPLIALRSGISNYNFKKNYFPLESTNGNLNFVLGLKQILHAGKQNISICLIGIIMSFTVIASFTILNNFTGKNSKLIQMVGLEKSNITITCSTEEECNEIMDKLKDYSELRKSCRFDYTDVVLSFNQKEISTCANVCEDFSELEVNTLSEGRFPRHDNEIALSYLNAKKLGVELGDVVTLKGKDGNFDYIVVGYTQHINHLGSSCSLTRDGMLRNNQDYFESMIYVYTKADVKVDAFLKTLENDLGHDSLSYINMDDAFNNTLKSVKTALEFICALLVGIAVVVISIILFYLVKVKLTRNKVLLGIQKAIGFTTKQLIIQNVVSFCLVQFISFLLGGILTIIFATPLCTLMFSVCDFKKCTMVLSPFIIISSIVALTIFSLLVTTIVSIRIRKINPRQLFMD